MSAQTNKKINKRTQRRVFRVRKKLMSKGQKFRVSIFRSLNQIYAQIIDDNTHATVASYSSLLLKENSGDKKEKARQVGVELGKLAISKSITNVFFDRGRYLYHGRIAALAEGLRESGIKF